jgi:hypothetical protein
MLLVQLVIGNPYLNPKMVALFHFTSNTSHNHRIDNLIASLHPGDRTGSSLLCGIFSEKFLRFLVVVIYNGLEIVPALLIGLYPIRDELLAFCREPRGLFRIHADDLFHLILQDIHGIEQIVESHLVEINHLFHQIF